MSSTKVIVICYTSGPSTPPPSERRRQSAGTSVLCRAELSISHHFSPSGSCKLINSFPSFPLYPSFYPTQLSVFAVDNLKKSLNFWVASRYGILVHHNPIQSHAFLYDVMLRIPWYVPQNWVDHSWRTFRMNSTGKLVLEGELICVIYNGTTYQERVFGWYLCELLGIETWYLEIIQWILCRAG